VAFSLEVRDSGVGHLRLASGRAGNPLDAALMSSLSRGLAEATSRQDVNCLLISAEGKHFSVGGDLTAFSAAIESGNIAELIEGNLQNFHAAITALVGCRLPRVVSVRGAVAGGALAILAACDYRVGAPSTMLVPAFGAIGLPPDTGAGWIMARAIGADLTRAIFLAGDPLDAEAARSVGLLHSVDADADAKALAVAEKIAVMGEVARSTSLRLLDAPERTSLGEYLRMEHEVVTRAAADRVFANRVMEFVKRQGTL